MVFSTLRASSLKHFTINHKKVTSKLTQKLTTDSIWRGLVFLSFSPVLPCLSLSLTHNMLSHSSSYGVLLCITWIPYTRWNDNKQMHVTSPDTLLIGWYRDAQNQCFANAKAGTFEYWFMRRIKVLISHNKFIFYYTT